MTEQLLPTLPDAVAYSEALRQSMTEGTPWPLDHWIEQIGPGDIFALCIALGLAGGLTVIGYTRANTLTITHRVVLFAAIVAVACIALSPEFARSPLTTALIVTCGAFALALEAIHRVRTIAAYAHIRTGDGS